MLKKMYEKIRAVCRKLVVVCGRGWSRFMAFCGRIGNKLTSFSKTKAYSVILKVVVVVIVLLGLVQFVFGVMIYGFKVENKATKFVAKILPYPVAAVNYDFVTYSEYESERDYIHHFYAATQQGDIDYKSIDSQIMVQLIENKIIDYEALKYRVKVSKKEIDDAVNNIAVQNGGQDKVVKVLSDLYGLSLSDFRDLVKTQMLRDKVNQAVVKHLTVRHILIQVASDAPADQVAAVQTKAQDVLNQINSGSITFEDAAKKYSEDSASASGGGLLDPFQRGDMVKPFSDAAFKLKVGQVSELVRSDYGWHIIKLESSAGKIDQSFTDWLDSIQNNSLILNLFKIV